VVDAHADDLRQGEEVVIEQGEVVPVDATVVAGNATVRPWPSATASATRDEGDPIVAGARVLEGRLRAIAGWAGSDRAFLRLTHDIRRRADLHAPVARLGRNIALRGSIVVAVVAALAAFSGDRDPVWIAVYATAAHAALANRAVAQLAALHVALSILASLRRGVVFRSAEALDRAGKVSSAAFCARGTLLLGEPEVASIEAFGTFDPDAVLALVAGTEGGATHPTAVAIQRAARARGIRPDGVRSPVLQAGLGVTAVAASGQTLVVGSRGLMLRERISVALAEARITDLEAMGRTVILVALGGRLAGLVGLQDGLRPGARAAVQHLLDVGIEPVLLSGDTRETCEALGRAVDIDHIRPEILPADRGDEIRRLAGGGAVVAVLGRSPNDDAALSAADVSVALDSAGSSAAEWSVQLASDDVRDGAFALRVAHGCRKDARLALIWSAGPSLAGVVLMSLSLAPVTAPALLMLLGGAVAAARLRGRR
jgi:Cu+-exporting ATPase